MQLQDRHCPQKWAEIVKTFDGPMRSFRKGTGVIVRLTLLTPTSSKDARPFLPSHYVIKFTTAARGIRAQVRQIHINPMREYSRSAAQQPDQPPNRTTFGQHICDFNARFERLFPSGKRRTRAIGCHIRDAEAADHPARIYSPHPDQALACGRRLHKVFDHVIQLFLPSPVRSQSGSPWDRRCRGQFLRRI